MMNQNLRVFFDPTMYEPLKTNTSSEDEFRHSVYISEIINFLYNNTLAVFDCYEEAPYYPDSPYKPPVSRYHYVNINTSLLYSKIQKMINYEMPVSLSEIEKAKCISNFNFPEKSEVQSSFLKYVTFLMKNNINALLLIGQANQCCEQPIQFNHQELKVDFIPIIDPELDCSNQLWKILKPCNGTNCFPNAYICSQLNQYFLTWKEQKMDSATKHAFIQKIGNEVALRNGFEHNKSLSAKNSKLSGKTRDIFTCSNFAFYLSLDFESGGFEVFNSSGTHLGQYSFAGCQTQGADPINHKIVL